MNWDQIAGNWKQLTGKVKEKWGKLTDDELTTIAGKRDQLAGSIQQHYGTAKEQAEKDADIARRSRLGVHQALSQGTFSNTAIHRGQFVP